MGKMPSQKQTKGTKQVKGYSVAAYKDKETGLFRARKNAAGVSLTCCRPSHVQKVGADPFTNLLVEGRFGIRNEKTGSSWRLGSCAPFAWRTRRKKIGT